MNSLHAIKAFAACTIVAMVFAGCSEDQTSLDVNSVPGRAKIIGSLTYSEGTVLNESNQFVELIKPAANKEVVFTIPNSAYTGNQGNEGYSKFTTTTDANGKYEIEIPASIVEATPISIYPTDFTGKFYRVIKENNKLKADTVEVVYRYDAYAPGNENTQVKSSQVNENNIATYATVTLYPNQICFADLRYKEIDAQDLEEGYTEYVNLTGVIGMNKKKYYGAEYEVGKGENRGMMIWKADPEVKDYFDKAPNVDLLIKIRYNGRTRNYNCTTNSNGEFSLNIPVKEFPCDINYTINAVPFASEFTYYEEIEKEWTEEEREIYDRLYYTDYIPAPPVKGYYYNYYENVETAETPASGNKTYTVKEESYQIKAKIMVFEENGEITFNPMNYPWLEDLDKED